MRLFSSNPDEFALFSVGQMAWGVIAFGQLARGFVAVGQLAIGVVAVGQASIGLLGGGMVGGGVLYFFGLGPGGRGLCLRLVPAVAPRVVDPPLVTLGDVWSGHAGLVRLDVVAPRAGEVPALGQDGHVLPIKLTPATYSALQTGWTALGGSVLAQLRRVGTFYVCDDLVVPGSAPRAKPVPALTALRLLGLLALAVGWWLVFAKLVLHS